MKKYIYQKFLLQCPFEEIQLDNYIWTQNWLPQDYREEWNIFDLEFNQVYRYILLSQLDERIDTFEDFIGILRMLTFVDVIVLINDRRSTANKHIIAYSTATLRAWIWQFRQNGFHCFWCY